MFVCGCRGRLEPAVELPLDRRHVDDVLVALGRAQHQRLEARVQDERRDRVHELDLEELDRRDLGQQEPPASSGRGGRPAADPGRAALGEELAARDEVLRQERHLRELGACRPTQRQRARAPSARPCRRADAAPRTRAPASRARAARLDLHHVPVEVRRPAHGLAGVVDDEVEPVARLVQVPAERLDARRVPQVEAVDLEPLAPVVEVGLLRVPGAASRGNRVVTISAAPARSSLIPAW